MELTRLLPYQVMSIVQNEIKEKLRKHCQFNYTENSSEVLDHFQIKSTGLYEKYEHTYDFSENGDLILDHSKKLKIFQELASKLLLSLKRCHPSRYYLIVRLN